MHRKDFATRLLHAYDLDARQSFAALSRKLGPSRDLVRRTIEQLEDTKTIKGYITVVDIGKLGYTGIAVYARLDSADTRKHQKLIEALQRRDDIYWTALLGGRFDILFAIQARSLVHFAEVLSDIQRRFPFVTNVEFAIRTRAFQFQRSYLRQNSANRIQGGFEASEITEKLTKRELNVLQQLIIAPRIPVAELAIKAGISRVTVMSIIKRLESRGIIQGYSALISCHAIGYDSFLILVSLRRFDMATRARLRKFAASEPEIIFCLETIGAWQTEFHCEVASQRDLQQLTRRFRESFPEEVLGIEIIAGIDYYLKYRYSV